MVDSYAMLADLVSNGRRTAVLKADSFDIQVRATALAADDDLLFVDVWLGDEVEHLGLVFDPRWAIPAVAQNHDRGLAYADLRTQLTDLDYVLGDVSDDRTLLADHVKNGRRTAVLQDDVGTWSLRAKVLLTEDEKLYVQLRIWYSERGFMHAVVDEAGTFITSVTGGTDKDTWDRLRGELSRRDIEVD
jgi:hypothetical protein